MFFKMAGVSALFVALTVLGALSSLNGASNTFFSPLGWAVFSGIQAALAIFFFLASLSILVDRVVDKIEEKE